MKSDFLKELKAMDNYTVTENGAIALRSTGNAVLNAFGLLGAMTNSNQEYILDTFYRAFDEDPELAMRLLFYIRDVRGGQGQRRVFRIILRNLAFTHPELIYPNLDCILFYGRGDDYLCLLDTPVEKTVCEYLYMTLVNDLLAVTKKQECSLLAKWMPSENTSSEKTKYFAKKFRKITGIDAKAYRKLLSTLRDYINIVETKMSQNRWEEIDFENLPSKAAMLYSDAFMKHTEDSYIDYLHKVVTGEAKINAGALFPVDIIHNVINKTEWNGSYMAKDLFLYDGMWNALPNYFGDTEETGLCVVDTSGSMNGKPIEVAISLGLYCADKAKGPFHNHFITFSNNPKLQTIKGENIFEKVRDMSQAEWMMNTNVERVFKLILDTALANNSPQSDLPDKLYIISDMQFDACAYAGRGSYNPYKPATLMKEMSHMYSEHGYTLPALVFWNVRASECGMFQMEDCDNCCMVSGYSASLFKSVIEGTEYEEETTLSGETITKQKLDPVTVMKNTLMNERYDKVVYEA